MRTGRLVCFFALFFSFLPLFAESNAVLTWDHADDSVSMYRWRRGDGEWTITTDSSIDAKYTHGSTEIYHIEASYDGNVWSYDHSMIITECERLYVSWSWMGDDGAGYHRWKLDDGPWTVVEAPVNSTGLIEIETGDSHRLSVQASYDGTEWSDSVESLLTTAMIKKKGIDVFFEASSSLSLSYAIYEFYNGYGIEGSRWLTKTGPGLTVDSELALSIGSFFRLFSGYSYSLENKKETIIPDAYRVHHHQIPVGFDVLIPFNSRWRGYIGFLGCYSADINSSYWSPSLFLGGRAGLDCFINDNIYVGLKGGFRIAHNDSSDPLNRSISYLIDPIGIRIGVRF